MSGETADKSMLRAFFRDLRRQTPPSVRQPRDATIRNRVRALAEYRDCGTLLVYVSKSDEVATDTLIASAWADGKTVAAPRSAPDGTMRFYRIYRWSDLRPGAFGVREPSDACAPVFPDDTALCVVPGMCFDRQGYRVGYGKGYYDRFLRQFPGKTVGLCPAAALVPQIPAEPTDQPVQQIVTEQEVCRVSGSSKEDAIDGRTTDQPHG